MAPRKPPNVNPRLHAAKQCAGYQRGVVIGDGGHWYRSQRWAPRAVDPEHEVCARCRNFSAPFIVARRGDWTRPAHICGLCLDEVTGRLPTLPTRSTLEAQ
jgi:hypothetical protein